MTDDGFKRAIEQGDVQAVRSALEAEPGLANKRIPWHLNQDNESDPLHYVSDCVGHGWLTNGKEAEIAALLLSHGAKINGTNDSGSPLIAAVSLGAPSVSKLLIEAGAKLEVTCIYGSRAMRSSGQCMGTARTVPERRRIRSAQRRY